MTFTSNITTSSLLHLSFRIYGRKIKIYFVFVWCVPENNCKVRLYYNNRNTVARSRTPADNRFAMIYDDYLLISSWLHLIFMAAFYSDRFWVYDQQWTDRNRSVIAREHGKLVSSIVDSCSGANGVICHSKFNNAVYARPVKVFCHEM